MSMIRRIFGNTAAQVASRVLSSGTGFLVTILVARHFGVAGYSNLAKITALVSLLYLGIDLGANALFLQMETDKQKLHNLISFRLLFAGILFIILSLVVGFLPYNAHTTTGYPIIVKIGIVLFACTFFSRAVIYSAAAVFQKNYHYYRATIASFFNAVVVICATVFIVFSKQSILWIIGAYLAGSYIEAFVSVYFVRKELVFTRLSLPFFKTLFFQTLPITFLLFLNLLYFRVDMILLSLLQKASAVGFYDFAYKFFDFLIALPLFLSNSLYPHLLLQAKNSRINIKNISLFAMLFFLLGLLLVPLTWFFAPLISLVKHEFVPSILILQILSLSLPVFFATSILQWIYIAKKKQQFLVVVYGISFIANIIANIMYIPRYSYIASAVITDISELFILGIMLVFLRFI